MAKEKLKRTSPELHFLKTFNLMNFRVFNPKFEQCLTGTERGLFDYILLKKLKYVGKTRPYGGNTIMIDIQFKKDMLKEFNISLKTYEGMITKLVNDNVLNRISNNYFQLNPYVIIKGKNEQLLRGLDIYEKSTLIYKDKPCKCTRIPSEDLEESMTANKKESKPKDDEPNEDDDIYEEDDICEDDDCEDDDCEDDDVPVMPQIKRNATMNRFFKK